jgi:hypothetical protein
MKGLMVPQHKIRDDIQLSRNVRRGLQWPTKLETIIAMMTANAPAKMDSQNSDPHASCGIIKVSNVAEVPLSFEAVSFR